jgi:hypothetical protein
MSSRNFTQGVYSKATPPSQRQLEKQEIKEAGEALEQLFLAQELSSENVSYSASSAADSSSLTMKFRKTSNPTTVQTTNLSDSSSESSASDTSDEEEEEEMPLTKEEDSLEEPVDFSAVVQHPISNTKTIQESSEFFKFCETATEEERKRVLKSWEISKQVSYMLKRSPSSPSFSQRLADEIYEKEVHYMDMMHRMMVDVRKNLGELPVMYANGKFLCSCKNWCCIHCYRLFNMRKVPGRKKGQKKKPETATSTSKRGRKRKNEEKC